MKIIKDKNCQILTDHWKEKKWKNYFKTLMNKWRNSTLVLIVKNKGDIQDCGNYRGIKLTLYTMRMWECIIERRINSVAPIKKKTWIYVRKKY